jgi:hypothetical protein
VASAIHADLNSTNEIHQSLAIAMIGALAPKELVEQLNKEVIKIAMNEASRSSLFVRKKAILAVLRMYRKYKEKFEVMDWVVPIINMFEQKYLSLGFVSSACSLLLGSQNLHFDNFKKRRQ